MAATKRRGLTLGRLSPEPRRRQRIVMLQKDRSPGALFLGLIHGRNTPTGIGTSWFLKQEMILLSRAAIPVTSKTALATMNTTTRNPGSLTGTKTTQAESAACYQVGSCVLQDSHAKDPYLISWEICRGMAAAILRTRPSVARCLHAILPEEEKGVVSTTTMTTVHILAMTADIAAC